MCGIAGILGKVGEENGKALERMNAALAHRGPDGEGYWHSSTDERGWGLLLASDNVSNYLVQRAARASVPHTTYMSMLQIDTTQ